MSYTTSNNLLWKCSLKGKEKMSLKVSQVLKQEKHVMLLQIQHNLHDDSHLSPQMVS